MSASSSPELLSNTLLALLVILNSAIFGYVAFRAFRIRRALLVPLYRNQALWTAAIALFWILIYLPLALPLSSTVTSYSLFAALFVGVVFFFAWYDVLVKIARSSDPLERDILGWRVIRLVLWGAVVVSIVLAFTVVAPAVTNGSDLPPVGQLVLFYVGNSWIFFLLGGVCALAVLIGSRRSGDPTLKRQLRWAGIYIVVLVLDIAVDVSIVTLSGGTVPLGSAAPLSAVLVPVEVVNFLLAFSLYKVSRSLVPTSRFDYRTNRPALGPIQARGTGIELVEWRAPSGPRNRLRRRNRLLPLPNQLREAQRPENPLLS
jgi:hypothetical protein